MLRENQQPRLSERTVPWFRQPLLLVILLALLLRWPSLEQPIDNDGGARAYHARLILAGEPLYSSHHPGHHLPGIYYLYATAMRLFGDNAGAIKRFLLLWTIPTIYALYCLGLLLMGRRAALLAAFFYAVMSAQVHMWGLTAETELFANLARITAVTLLIYLLQTKAASWRYIFVGLFSAAAFMFKAIYLSPLALTGFALLTTYWHQRRRPRAWRQLAARSAWVGFGFGVVLLFTALYFVRLGLWPRLQLVFSLGQSYGVSSPINTNAVPPVIQWLLYLLLPLYGLAFNNAVLLFLSLAGFLIILAKRPYQTTTLLYLAVWYALSFMEAGINLELFTHYYLLIVPAMALLAAWLVGEAYETVKTSRYGRAAPIMVVGLILFTLAPSVWRNAPYYYHFARYKLGQETLAESVINGWPGFGERLIRATQTAEYVKATTHANDLVYIWSEDTQLYYLAQRRSPIDFIWPIDVAATSPPEHIFRPQTTLIIIDLRRDTNLPDWLATGLAKAYELETTFQEQAFYRRVD